MKPLNQKKVRIAHWLRPIWTVLALFVNRSLVVDRNREPQTVLVFDFHLIGDLVLLTPMLEALRRGYPQATIVLVAGPWALDVLKGTKWVDEIVTFTAPWVKRRQGWRAWLRCALLVRELRKRHVWDLGIEVRGDIRQILMLLFSGVKRRVGIDITGGGALLTDVLAAEPALVHVTHYHKRLCEILGVWPTGADYLPALCLTPEEKLKVASERSFIGLHFGASLPLKRAPVALATQLIRHLAIRNHVRILVFRLPDDEVLTKALEAEVEVLKASNIEIDLWSGSLRDLIVVLSKCEMLYAMDSAVAHIASALGVSVRIFYGPTDPATVKPLGNFVSIVRGPSVECYPCDLRICVASEKQACMPKFHVDLTASK